MKLYFYLDTNVYWRLIETSNWQAVALLKEHRRRFRLSAITLMELVEDLRTCSPEKFKLHKQSVELARQVGGLKIMAERGEFLAKHLFNTSFANPHLAVHRLARWLEVAIRHQNQEDLSLAVKMGHLRGSLDFDYIAKCQEAWRRSYQEKTKTYIESLVAQLGTQPTEGPGGPIRGASAKGVKRFFESHRWKRLYVQKLAKSVHKESLNEGSLDKIYPSLEAGCKFLATILQQSLCDGYHYEVKANDIVDEAQLHYLCDPSLTFVTNDGRLCKKIQGCSQSKRVITFNELEEELEHAV